MPKTIYVASIFPFPQTFRRDMWSKPGTPNVYPLPAVKRGEQPFILEVEEQWQLENIPIVTAETGEKQRITIPNNEIADCLIDVFSKNWPFYTPDSRPGIWILKDDIETVGEKGAVTTVTKYRNRWTAEDLERETRVQTAFLEQWVMEGDRLAAEGRARHITPLMKAACDWLALKRPWRGDLAADAKKQCVYCTEFIAAQAIICPNCTKVVDPVRYKQLQDQAQAVADGALPPEPEVVAEVVEHLTEPEDDHRPFSQMNKGEQRRYIKEQLGTAK